MHAFHRHSFGLAVAAFGLVVGIAITPEVADAQRRGGGGRGGGGFRGGGGGFRGGGGAARTSVNRDFARPANRDFARPANRDISRNVNRDRNINRDVNRNINRDWNVDVDVDRDWHPVARGVAWGAAAAVTAAAVGSVVYSLPPSCVTTVVGGVSYYQCGGTWYAPQMEGTSVTYVVVSPP